MKSNKPKLLLIRYQLNPDSTLGWLHVLHPSGKILDTFATLELPWIDNQPRISCIPEGQYPVVLEYSPKFESKLWELYQVPNRSEVKIHAANYTHEIEGCIALGLSHKDINKDGIMDVVSSKKAMNNFHNLLRDFTSTTLKIVNYD
jgi:hypothetical protein